MDAEEREHAEALLQLHRRRLYVLQQQAALYGINTAPHISIEIEDVQREMLLLEQKIERLQGRPNTDNVLAPDKGTQQPHPIPSKQDLFETCEGAIEAQRKADTPGSVVPEIRSWFHELCQKLDFVVDPASYHLHHARFAICIVKAPTLHVNLPSQFPLMLVLDRELSPELVEQIADLLKIIDIPADFGLIFTAGSHTRTQQLIDRVLRPAAKIDLIVLGRGFLEKLVESTNPQATLMTEILRSVDLTRVSPFMAGGADLGNRMFFGRAGELKNIAEAITKTSVAITCGRRIGKTTLLNRLARVTLPARNHPCFFLNCQPVHDYHELRSEMAAVWKLPNLPFDPAQPNSFAQVAAALTGPGGAPPIFLLDEVDELLRYDGQHQQRLFKQLRALSLDGRARFIMTGERSVQAHLHNADSPLFNFFGLNVRLSFLDIPSVNKLVVEPLSDMQIELEDPALLLAAIFDTTSGHPYLVQRLCQGLVQMISRERRRSIRAEHLELVLNDSAYQQDYFETVWGQAPLLARIITLVVGPQGATMKAIREQLARYGVSPSLREIDAALAILDLYSVLTNRGGTYQFVAKAFPDMVRRAYGDDRETNIELRCEEYLCEQQASNLLVP